MISLALCSIRFFLLIFPFFTTFKLQKPAGGVAVLPVAGKKDKPEQVSQKDEGLNGMYYGVKVFLTHINNELFRFRKQWTSRGTEFLCGRGNISLRQTQGTWTLTTLKKTLTALDLKHSLVD